MPFDRGRAPTSIATFTPSNALFASSKISVEASSGKAQSCSSIAVPSAALHGVGDLEQPQVDLLVRAEHLPARDPEQQRVADLRRPRR